MARENTLLDAVLLLLAAVRAASGAVEGVQHAVRRPQPELRRLEADQVVGGQAEVAAGGVLGVRLLGGAEHLLRGVVDHGQLDGLLVGEADGPPDRLGVDL